MQNSKITAYLNARYTYTLVCSLDKHSRLKLGLDLCTIGFTKTLVLYAKAGATFSLLIGVKQPLVYSMGDATLT